MTLSTDHDAGSFSDQRSATILPAHPDDMLVVDEKFFDNETLTYFHVRLGGGIQQHFVENGTSRGDCRRRSSIRWRSSLEN